MSMEIIQEYDSPSYSFKIPSYILDVAPQQILNEIVIKISKQYCEAKEQEIIKAINQPEVIERITERVSAKVSETIKAMITKNIQNE